MTQISRNLTDAEDGFLVGKRFLIHDRDLLFTAEFRETLAAAGVESVRLPARSPNLNAYAERFVRTIKESCLERMILFGEPSLRRATSEFLAHYHRERNHRGLDNRLVFPGRQTLIWPLRSSAANGWAECSTTTIGKPPEVTSPGLAAPAGKPLCA